MLSFTRDRHAIKRQRGRILSRQRLCLGDGLVLVAQADEDGRIAVFADSPEAARHGVRGRCCAGAMGGYDLVDCFCHTEVHMHGWLSGDYALRVSGCGLAVAMALSTACALLTQPKIPPCALIICQADLVEVRKVGCTAVIQHDAAIAAIVGLAHRGVDAPSVVTPQTSRVSMPRCCKMSPSAAA